MAGPGVRARRDDRAADRVDRGDGPAGGDQRGLLQPAAGDRGRGRARARRPRSCAASTREDIDILHLPSELVVDAVVEPADLRGEIARRFAHAATKSRELAGEAQPGHAGLARRRVRTCRSAAAPGTAAAAGRPAAAGVSCCGTTYPSCEPSSVYPPYAVVVARLDVGGLRPAGGCGAAATRRAPSRRAGAERGVVAAGHLDGEQDEDRRGRARAPASGDGDEAAVRERAVRHVHESAYGLLKSMQRNSERTLTTSACARPTDAAPPSSSLVARRR